MSGVSTSSEDRKIVPNRQSDPRTERDGVGHRLSGVETHVAGLETRIVEVETRLNGVETRLNGVETRLTGVETRLAQVEAKMEFVATREDIANMGRELATLIANKETTMQRWLLGITSAALASVLIALLRTFA